MNNNIYNRIKNEHPDWSDEQIWTAVSIELQSDAVIEKSGADVNPNDPDLIEGIIRGAEAWLESVLPQIFEKVEQLFTSLLENIGAWIRKGLDYIIHFIGDYFSY